MTSNHVPIQDLAFVYPDPPILKKKTKLYCMQNLIYLLGTIRFYNMQVTFINHSHIIISYGVVY